MGARGRPYTGQTENLTPSYSPASLEALSSEPVAAPPEEVQRPPLSHGHFPGIMHTAGRSGHTGSCSFRLQT